MKDLTQKADAMVQSLGLDARVITQRKAFLELGNEDETRLRRAHQLLEGQSARLAETFYSHLLQFEPMRQLLRNEERLAHLKAVQGHYFNSLTAGEYGSDYVRDRLRVGLIHQQLGLEPAWYLGAYRKYVAEMQNLLWEVLEHDPPEFLKTCDALNKVVNFDIGLALDTYFQAGSMAIQELKQYSENIFSAMPVGLMVVSANLIVLSMNPAMRSMLGLSDDQSGEGVPVSTLVKSSLLQGACHEVLETGETHEKLVVSQTRDNNQLRFEFSLKRIQVRGKPQVLVTTQDMTTRSRTEAQLAQSEARYRLIFDLAAVGMAQVDMKGRITQINKKFCDVLGYEHDELMGIRIVQLAQHEDRDDIQASISSVAAGSLENYSKERRYLHKEGQVIWVNVTVSCLRADDQRTGLIVILEDISARKHMEQELVHMAGHDSLTGLLNRVMLHDRLSKALILARRNHRQVAVLYLDLDHFKHVNDSQGHAAGDAMLAEAARRLLRAVRETDTVARLGGDQFVVVLENLASSHEGGARAQGLLRALSEPFFYKDQVFRLGASIGIALYDKDGPDSDTLLKHADSAMRQAKEAGRNNVQFYTPELNAQHARRAEIADGLRFAQENNELHLHYQPKIDTLSGQVVGVEVLLRWTRRDGSMVGPDEFIPIAEDTGMILLIGEWVLQQACRQIVTWRRRTNSLLRISVNMSAHQLQSQGIVQVVQKALAQAHCPADALELEITESVLMEHPERTTATLEALHRMGVRLSIDDFGTGYSSLSYLRNFPIHELKIDRSFIDDITHDDSHAAIVKAIINLAHNLKLTVVAEGVETPEQLQYLRNEHCDYLQGYLFSRPVPARKIDGLLGESLL